MRLASLIDGLPIQLVSGSADVDVRAVVEDSRQVSDGSLFVARSGLVHDGQGFIADAVAAGAVAVLADRAVQCGAAACLVADDVAYAAALLAERFSGDPSASLRLIGITGTNGKTTTSYLLHHLLNHAGQRCGLIGTVHIDDGKAVQEAHLTTPPALSISPALARMVLNGCNACAMEVSSHALKQQRTAGLAFGVAIFTNISGDHLDYHPTIEDYIASKVMLFSGLPENGVAIVNTDDDCAEAMLRDCRANVLRCSLVDQGATCFAEIEKQTITHVDVVFDGPWGRVPLRLPLCGTHNVMNALQAAAAAHVLGVDRFTLAEALAVAPAPPGRLEPVTQQGDPFAVYVDYAHTDDALENVLRALRRLIRQGGKLRVVFGCGGDRDRTKRPRMANVACQWADQVVITSDNPRTEDPQAIVDDVFAGVPGDKAEQVMCMVDRRQAIKAAIEQAQRDDVVLIAGKGHETYQIIGTQRCDFDDRRVAAEALANLRDHGRVTQ